jgi:hypothetical protein
MLEIEQLEREWRRYKLKRYRPFFIATFMIVGFFLIYMFLQELNTTPLEKEKAATTDHMRVRDKETRDASSPATSPQRTEPIRKSSKKDQEILHPVEERARTSTEITMEKGAPQTPSSSTPKKPEKEVVLNPDTAFLSSFEENSGQSSRSSSSIRHEVIRPVAAKRKEKKRNIKYKAVSEYSAAKKSRTVMESSPNTRTGTSTHREVEPVQKEQAGGKLVISKKQTNNTLEYLIERFNQTRDPKLASYIAQSFYKKGNYEETVRWAIIANSIEPASEESWILFAKAKVNLGQKEDAIKALKIYLNQYSSRKVKSYLQTLETGL